jgi:serine/alanine adding enzyme
MQMIRDKDEKAWGDYVTHKEDASFFHLLLWKKVIQHSFGFQPYYLCSRNAEGRINGVLPLFFIKSRLTGNRLVSLPFSYICGPMVDSKEITEKLLKEGLQIFERTRAEYFEVKTNQQDETMEKQGFRASTYYRTYIVQLSNPEENWRNLHKSSTQRSINKAKKEKVEIQFAESEEELRQFHRLNLGTCRFHGIPPQPYSFFKRVWDILVQKGSAKLALARYQKATVAGAFFFLFRDTLYYMYGASDQDHLFCRPNHLLLWETMLWAIENDYRFFDLGRVSQDNLGLAEFKKRWGAQERQLYYYYWPEIKGVGVTDRAGWKYRLATGVWKRMPLRLTQKGAFLYKHLG